MQSSKQTKREPVGGQGSDRVRKLPAAAPAVVGRLGNLAEAAQNSPGVGQLRRLQHVLSTRDARYGQIGAQSVLGGVPGGHVAPVQRATDYASETHEGQVTVDVAGGRVVLTGQARLRGGDAPVDVTGSVSLHAVDIPENKLKSDGDAGTAINCLRVFGLQASARGLKIGQLLTLHHGLEAQARGLEYVVAQSVSGAGGPFYIPLGFRDFVGDAKWETLNTARVGLEARIQAGVPPLMDGSDPTMAYIQVLQETRDALANVSMFIKTSDLIANSRAAINGVWA